MIRLGRYCTENYLLDLATLGAVAPNGKDPLGACKQLISGSGRPELAVMRALLEQRPDLPIAELQPLLATVNGKHILEPLLARLGYEGKAHEKISSLLPAYFSQLKQEGRFDEIFDDFAIRSLAGR